MRWKTTTLSHLLPPPPAPVWARRPKPARPAGAERTPLSPSSPHAAEPLGSWSPDFSVRVVTQARGGAGRKQNGLPRQLAGVPAGPQALKVSIFLIRGRSPQRHRGCREAESGIPHAGKVPVGFFFLPRLSFSRTKKKDGVREWHRFNRDAGGGCPAYKPQARKEIVKVFHVILKRLTYVATLATI